MASMLDAEIRGALQERLTRTHKRELVSTRFVEELGVAGEARIDMAVLNGAFAGYEIKSERDTLRRLPGQVTAYSKVLDYCTLVVATRHASHAAALIPDWWGLMEARRAASGVRLVSVRRALRNRSLDAYCLSTLMWRDEALQALRSRGLDRGVRGASNSEIWRRLANEVPTPVLRHVVRETLKERQGWRPVPV